MLAAEIKRRALELGFDLVGVTSAEPPPHVAQYRQWLADGFHGEMAYMARNAGKRADPQQVLPGAKSVIVVGMNYTPLPATRGEGVRRTGEGRVARYAAGARDYHDVMGEKLRQLAELVDGIWCVDTGPVLERDLAQRAGIGFIGKHTNLISRQVGNWFFLGEVLTRMELPADPPEREHCGTCTRCIKACPTGAIVAPYRLDARRCISYLTIELKASMPEELRSKIGDRIFGCDDCLEVCPWNRFAKPVIRAREWPALTALDSWDVRGTPLERLGRARLLRNICVALGNTGDRSVLPALERACRDESPLVREHAQWAVERIRQC
jgi:epoxyqueuosine reductase